MTGHRVSMDWMGKQVETLADLFADNARRWLAGQPLVNVVDKALGYVPGEQT